MERSKGQCARQNKLEESTVSRIDAKQVIDELIKSANLENDESEQGTLYARLEIFEKYGNLGGGGGGVGGGCLKSLQFPHNILKEYFANLSLFYNTDLVSL